MHTIAFMDAYRLSTLFAMATSPNTTEVPPTADKRLRNGYNKEQTSQSVRQTDRQTDRPAVQMFLFLNSHTRWHPQSEQALRGGALHCLAT